MPVAPKAGYDSATVGAPADQAMLDVPDPVTALRTVAAVLAAFKRGRRTVSREPVRLHRP